MAESAAVNTSGFTPAGNKLLIEPMTIEKTTASGIVLVTETTGKEKNAQVVGTLIAVGNSCWKDTLGGAWAQPGATVVYAKYAGMPWKGNDGKEYRIINDLEVVGCINQQENSNGR